jgi:hypothetical protein
MKPIVVQGFWIPTPQQQRCHSDKKRALNPISPDSSFGIYHAVKVCPQYLEAVKASDNGCSVASSNLSNSFVSGQRALSASHSLTGLIFVAPLHSARSSFVFEDRLLYFHHPEEKEGCSQSFKHTLDISTLC